MNLSEEQKAFILVCGAGMSTILGAAVVLNNKLVNLANKLFLAAVVSLAAGVMLFVSMVEIFVKSKIGFQNFGYSGSASYLYTTLSFFGGIVFYTVLDVLVHVIESFNSRGVEDNVAADHHAMVEMTLCIAEAGIGTQEKIIDEQIKTAAPSSSSNSSEEMEVQVKTGIMLAIAIGVHNFPEGLATFVGTLADPVVGIALAVAIGIHNIPEGLCVAIPVYYATKDRWRAFWWAVLCGLTEPLGAGLGWLILKDHFDNRVYGIIFGLVSGMMTIICLKDLIPMAVHYDPENRVTTLCLVVGMAIMAASLVLFAY